MICRPGTPAPRPPAAATWCGSAASAATIVHANAVHTTVALELFINTPALNW
jgi:hypothetical protein